MSSDWCWTLDPELGWPRVTNILNSISQQKIFHTRKSSSWMNTQTKTPVAGLTNQLVSTVELRDDLDVVNDHPKLCLMRLPPATTGPRDDQTVQLSSLATCPIPTGQQPLKSTGVWWRWLYGVFVFLGPWIRSDRPVSVYVLLSLPSGLTHHPGQSTCSGTDVTAVRRVIK